MRPSDVPLMTRAVFLGASRVHGFGSVSRHQFELRQAGTSSGTAQANWPDCLILWRYDRGHPTGGSGHMTYAQPSACLATARSEGLINRLLKRNP